MTEGVDQQRALLCRLAEARFNAVHRKSDMDPCAVAGCKLLLFGGHALTTAAYQDTRGYKVGPMSGEETMLYSVNDDLRGFLLALPESGMGYQLLERDDGEDRLLILNAELGVSVKAMHELAIKRDHRGQLAVVDQSLPVLAIDPQSVKVHYARQLSVTNSCSRAVHTV